MSNMDDLLQNQLEALESGKPLKAVLQELPEPSGDLAEMIQIASTVRDLHHPQPRNETNPARGLRTGALTSNLPFWRFEWLQVRPALMLSGVVISALVLLVAFVSILGVGLWASGPRHAQAATLMGITGQVEVASSATAADWRLVSDGHKVVEGQRVRTGVGATATLVFYEGSRAILGSYTDLTLSTVEGGWGRTLRVVLDQRMGETIHSVVPFSGSDSLYYVQTPAGTASVHGTVFSVDVDVNGLARFAVNTGKVLVSGQTSDVWLDAGQTTAVQPGLAPLDPSYQFELKGEVQEIISTTWKVNGVYFDVTSGTVIVGNPVVSDFVEVEGHVLGGGAFEADHIEPASGDPKASFSGMLDSIPEDPAAPWMVSGIPVYVDSNTDVDEDVEEGKPVEVDFVVRADDTWLATKIDSLAEEPEPEPEPEPVLTLTKSANPMQYETAGDVITYTYEVSNTGSVEVYGPFTVDDDKTIDETCPASPDSLLPGESITCSAHYVITEADLSAESVTNTAYTTAENNGAPVTSNTDTLTIYYYLSVETQLTLTKSASPSQFDAVGDVITYTFEVRNTGNTVIYGPFTVFDDKTTDEACPASPDSLSPGESITCSAHYTITGDDLNAGSVTNEAYATAENNGSPITSNTDTATVTSSLETECTGNESHPKGQKLAEEHGVPYAEIMGWFCQRFGFGEIDLAYSLARTYGVSAEQLFDLRRTGLGWGQIKNMLKQGLILPPSTTPPPDTDAPAEPKKNGPPAEKNKPELPGKQKKTNSNGQSLAQRYGVAYDTIMGWYNAGHSFSDINQAYSLSRDYNRPVDDIFNMRSQGMSWGQIRQELRNKPSKKP